MSSGIRHIKRYGECRLQAKFDVPPGNIGAAGYIEVVGGWVPYLWIGNDEKCHATISGKRTLRKFAEAILKELP